MLARLLRHSDRTESCALSTADPAGVAGLNAAGERDWAGVCRTGRRAPSRGRSGAFVARVTCGRDLAELIPWRLVVESPRRQLCFLQVEIALHMTAVGLGQFVHCQHGADRAAL